MFYLFKNKIIVLFILYNIYKIKFIKVFKYIFFNIINK